VQPTALRDELTVAVQAADVVDSDGLVANLERRIEQARHKRAHLEDLEQAILGGRNEEEFLRTTRHLGPYLTCRRGIRFETDTEEWCTWAIGLLRGRRTGSEHGRGAGQPAADAGPETMRATRAAPPSSSALHTGHK
jgi:Virulence activator alpha C-term